MRCPQCGSEQKHKEGMRCRKCRYRFVFHKRTDGISDQIVASVIEGLAEGGQNTFTRTQLAMALSRFRRSKGRPLTAGHGGSLVA